MSFKRYFFCAVLILVFLSSTADSSTGLLESSQRLEPIPDGVFYSRRILVSPDSRPGTYSIEQLRRFLGQLQPGTRIEFAAGVYHISKPIVFESLRDIQIVGTSETIFQGVKGPRKPRLKRQDCSGSSCVWESGPWKPQYSNFEGFAVFKVRGSKGIKFSKFNIRNSWPNGIELTNSQGIEIDDIEVRGGTNAIFAQSKIRSGLKTRRITIRNSYWIQDVALWDYLTWQHVHHGKENFLNGAFFQGRNIAGDVRIEGNVIEDAFNAVRIKVSPKLCSGVKRCRYNRNVVIDGNQFYRISDNVIEPETYAFNWIVTNNIIVDTHAAFSFDGVRGHSFYLANNITRIESKPRTQISYEALEGLSFEDRDPHNGGCIFKLKGVGKIKNFVIENNEFIEDYSFKGEKGKKFYKGKFPRGATLRRNTIRGNFRGVPQSY